MCPRPNSKMETHSVAAAVVVVGAGQAGVQVADALRDGGHHGRLTVVADEAVMPYDRPPLSKTFLEATEENDVGLLAMRVSDHFMRRGIDLRLGVAAMAIDRAGKSVALSDGSRLPYDYLVLATGATPRTLQVPGNDLEGVFTLRTLDDAIRLRKRLRTACSILIAGGGFIGLEVAAMARRGGLGVTVLEAAERPLERAISPQMAGYLVDAQRRAGVDLRLDEGISRIAGESGHVSAVISTRSQTYRPDLVVVAIGVAPRDEIAKAAGIAVSDGIVVDASLRTSDPAIFAIGDCASHPNVHASRRIRLESVQNATDQGRFVAHAILGNTSESYGALPWFWSHQGDLRLQIAGVRQTQDTAIVLGEPETGRFSVCSYRSGRLVAVESLNRPVDHQTARKLLQAGISPEPALLEDPNFALKDFLREATTQGRAVASGSEPTASL